VGEGILKKNNMKALRFFIVLIVASCQPDRSAEIDQAMMSYDLAVLHQDAQAISEIYLPDGKLGGEGWSFIAGKDSIRKFLGSFKNVKILANHSTSSSINIMNDSAIQRGEYRQVAVVQGDTLEFTGQFKATWKSAGLRGWLLRTMYTSHYQHRSIKDSH
jgi:Domain of unknown function (DUF4440)